MILSAILLVVIMLAGCTSTPAPTTPATPQTTAAPTSSGPVSGGNLIMAGSQTPKNIGYQPTMALIDKTLIFTTIAERLMNMNTKGELVPELATEVKTDPAAKTITWTLRKGVKFHDGTDFNAKAAAWNFQQMKDAGVLQFGKSIVSIETPDEYTLKFNLSEFAYQYVMAYSFNVFMLSPKGIEENGKDWAITHVSATGPFMLQEFDPASKVVVVKNPNYWQSGKPYLDSITQLVNLDSAVLSAQIQSNEINFLTSGDLVMQKNLVSKGFKQVVYTPNQTFTFLVPSSADSKSPLSNPLVRQACEYAVDRAAICNGLLQGTSKAALQMSYEGAVGYDPARGRQYDVAKAKQLMEQAGYAGKEINISIYGSNSKPSQDRRTAIADYLKEIGIIAKVEALPFASYSTMQSEGWENGFMDCVENSGAVWAVGYSNWLGPKPTLSPVPSLGRPDDYNALANKVLTAPDAAANNDLIAQLIQKNFDEALTFPLWSQGNTYIRPDFVHTEEAEGNNRTFAWFNVWIEKK